MNRPCYRKILVRLSISNAYIFQFLNNYNLKPKEIQDILDIVEDRNLYDIMGGGNLNEYAVGNYNPSYVLMAQDIFRIIVLEALGVSENENVQVVFSVFYEHEFISMTHVDCDVAVKFFTKESFNYFKIKNPDNYQRLIQYEEKKKEYDKRVAEKKLWK